jgi:beta-lactam-binding protein with PASTA domain
VVPRLSRSSLYGTARSKIKRAGCAVGKVRRVRSYIKRGRLVRTRPGGSKNVAAGTRVAIDLSDGKGRKPRKKATRKRSSTRAVQTLAVPADRRAPLRNARGWTPPR